MPCIVSMASFKLHMDAKSMPLSLVQLPTAAAVTALLAFQARSVHQTASLLAHSDVAYDIDANALHGGTHCSLNMSHVMHFAHRNKNLAALCRSLRTCQTILAWLSPDAVDRTCRQKRTWEQPIGRICRLPKEHAGCGSSRLVRALLLSSLQSFCWNRFEFNYAF